MAATDTPVVGRAYPMFFAEETCMKITDVHATWLRYPIPPDKQHVATGRSDIQLYHPRILPGLQPTAA